jgi:hypothetical protein
VILTRQSAISRPVVISNGSDGSYSQAGGASVGSWNASIPLAVLSVHPNALRLSCFGQDCVFFKHNIIALTRYRLLHAVGLRIHHDVAPYPNFVVFWVSSFLVKAPFVRLKERLEACRYEVKN